MNHYKPKNYLVTGGAGFIGSNFIYHLLDTYDEINIVNIDKLTYAAQLDNLTKIESSKRYTFLKVDICDQNQIENILRKNHIDTIVHFAAESHVDRSIKTPEIFLKTNVYGTYSLLEAAKNVWLNEEKRNISECKFHHVSTDEVYGALTSEEPSFTEEFPYKPNSPYSATKASSNHLVHAYHATYKLPISLSNCSNNYGPFQHKEKLIPTIIFNCLANKPIPIYHNGSNVRDWIYVKDHCIGLDLIIRDKNIGEKYNIGGNAELSNLTLTHLICKILSTITHKPVDTYLSLITFVPDRLGHDFRYSINNEKMQKKFNWRPATNLEEGLRNTILWYLNLNLH
ncbi:MAG TPA: dTDP-glucose 4,6-dehydratase [Gammaproteobacteria bacterium]|jgi:dTDP-glucose 4,6-dehydratase|nr:dTDP-glucose 4,6-dehydratase [Gammaproteobacteria bacterium]